MASHLLVHVMRSENQTGCVCTVDVSEGEMRLMLHKMGKKKNADKSRLAEERAEEKQCRDGNN